MMDTEQGPRLHSGVSRTDNEALTEEGPYLTLPVIQEELDISKRVVNSGAIRLRKIVHEEVVTVDEPLEFEVTEVERVSIGLPVDAEVAVRYEGDVVIYPVVEERLVTRKQLVLVEEIRVTRRTRPQTLPQQVTLRREEVVGERVDLGSGEWKSLDSVESKACPTTATAKSGGAAGAE